MADQLVVLKPNVVIEPLIASWHAWSHLVSPATAALNFAHHLKQMRSFVEAPDLHAMACKDPKLKGGPFVDLPESNVDNIRDLIAKTQVQQQKQLNAGADLHAVLKLLSEKAEGFSLEDLYNSIPESIKGYIELTYNLLGNPDLRVLEALLYKSPIYDYSLQSAKIYAVQDDQRPFVFSTPRLMDQEAVEIKKPFHDDIYDDLAKLRQEPREKEEIFSLLELNQKEKEIFGTFLDNAPLSKPKISTEYNWRYFGHACVLVQSNSGATALVDPLIPYKTSGETERYSFEDLPEYIDYIVLTHNHTDHVLIETLLALRHKTGKIITPASGGNLADPSLKLMLEAIGFSNVIELGYLDTIEHGDMRLTPLPFLGEHGDLDIRTKAAWLIDITKTNYLFAADSNNLEPRLYDIIKNVFGEIENLFIGMECVGAPMSWVYGPLLPSSIDRKKDNSRRLNGSNFESAIKVVDSLGSKKVFVYAMGMEPWLEFITAIGKDDDKDTTPQMMEAHKFVAKCIENSIPAEILYGRSLS
jgi:L-ascorbate metabolism protein UlaG (beta-lactamase superfamily)